MRRVATFIMGMLPLDQDGRRAADETMADWRHETSHASSFVARVRVGVCGLLALASVLSRAAITDFRRPGTYGLTVGTIGLSLLIGFALVVVRTQHLLYWPVPLKPTQTLALFVFLLPQAVAITLPVAALVPPFVRQRAGASSLIAVTLVLTMLSIVNVGWVMPRGNQAFRESMASIANAATPEPRNRLATPRPGFAEMTWTELLTLEPASSRSHQLVVRQISARTVAVLMVAISLLLSGQAQRFRHPRGWLAGGALLAVGVEFAIQVVSVGVWQPWGVPAATTFAAVFLAWFASRREQQAGESALVAR